MDILYAVQYDLLYKLRSRGGGRNFYRRILDNHDQPEFYRNHSPDARPRLDLVSAAYFHLVDVREQRDSRSQYAGAGDHIGHARRGTRSQGRHLRSGAWWRSRHVAAYVL